MTYRALVPVKALNEAKSRLERHLTLHQRENLVMDMLHHVLQTLRDSELLEQVAVVSPDARVLEQAQAWGAQALMEEQHGHNPALHAAALREKTEGVTALLTISADLPLLNVCDICTLIEQSERYSIVLAPSQEGTGTNAILMRPPLALPYLFGPGSLQRYLQAVRQRELSYTIHSSPGLAFDIDTIDDLRKLRVLCCASRGNTEFAIHNL